MLNRIHAYLGLVLVLPLFVWAVTGFFFLIKPGYEDAYEQLNVTQQPFPGMIQLAPQPHWREIQVMQTMLGTHLLVTTTDGERMHLDPGTLQPRRLPTAKQLHQLFKEATAHNRERYGDLLNIDRVGDRLDMVTTTRMQVQLDWQTLRLQQRGEDTRFIDRLYRMHYLQWSPTPMVNRVLAALALLALLAMCFLGLRMLIVFHNKEQL